MAKQFQKYVPKVFLIFFLLLLLFAPEASLRGAKSGLLLWFHKVLPSLLPFFIVSGLIVATGLSRLFADLAYPLFHPLFHCSRAGCYPILIGFLSGLPLGAKTISDLVKTGQLSRSEGQYLLPLCNNSGPLFILSYIALSELNAPEQKYLLLLCIYGSSILAALLSYALFYRKEEFSKEVSCDIAEKTSKNPRFTYAMLDNCIMDGFEVLAKVGGYIILFSILAETAKSLLPASTLTVSLLSGLLEITTGIHLIAALLLPFGTKAALIAAVTSFGGLSGLAQTGSVIGNSGLSLFPYVLTKAVGAALAWMLLSLLYVL